MCCSANSANASHALIADRLLGTPRSALARLSYFVHWPLVTPRARLALALTGTLLALIVFGALTEPSLRGGLAIALLLALLTFGRGRPNVQDFLLTPVLVLLVAGETVYSFDLDVAATFVAFLIVASFTVLGKWVLWTVRPDTGHFASA